MKAGKVKVLAPQGFTRASVEENVLGGYLQEERDFLIGAWLEQALYSTTRWTEYLYFSNVDLVASIPNNTSSAKIFVEPRVGLVSNICPMRFLFS